MKNRFGVSCCCGTPGGGGSTPGFEACCPSNEMPTDINMTFSFGGGFTSATYYGHCHDTALTYYTTPPVWASGPGNRYFSPTFLDSFGSTCYYSLSCSLGFLALGFSDFAGFGPTACGLIVIQDCDPLLASGIAGGASGGGSSTSPTCISDTGGGGVAGVFGTHVGDNITIS